MLTSLGALVLLLSQGCSCVFYDSDESFSYAVTAAHCVGEEGGTVNCVNDGKVFGCRIMSVDRRRDLALLKAFVSSTGPIHCPFGDCSIGCRLVLVGYPGGVKHLTSGILTERKLGGTESHFVSGTEGVRGGISGGGVFSDNGLVGVVTHSAVIDGQTGAGCSIVDRIVDRQGDRAYNRAEASLEETFTPKLRDLIVMVLGWLARFWVPGASMMTSASHKAVLDGLKPKP